MGPDQFFITLCRLSLLPFPTVTADNRLCHVAPSHTLYASLEERGPKQKAKRVPDTHRATQEQPSEQHPART